MVNRRPALLIAGTVATTTTPSAIKGITIKSTAIKNTSIKGTTIISINATSPPWDTSSPSSGKQIVQPPGGGKTALKHPFRDATERILTPDLLKITLFSHFFCFLCRLCQIIFIILRRNNTHTRYRV